VPGTFLFAGVAMARVRFTVGELAVEAEFDDTPTALALQDAFPMEAQGSYWGGELYFTTPVKAKPDATAREVVEPGTVAFWVAGSCLCPVLGRDAGEPVWRMPSRQCGKCRGAGDESRGAAKAALTPGAYGSGGVTVG
jgi:hypothetical protein